MRVIVQPSRVCIGLEDVVVACNIHASSHIVGDVVVSIQSGPCYPIGEKGAVENRGEMLFPDVRKPNGRELGLRAVSPHCVCSLERTGFSGSEVQTPPEPNQQLSDFFLHQANKLKTIIILKL